MNKTICGKTYDTETSQLVKKLAYGEFGQSDGWEESLYLTDEGLYFLYFNGGETSPHPSEKITRMSKVNAEKWLAENA